jgi:hypothetical protein
MKPVRDQILQPEENIIAPFVANTPNTDRSSRRLLFIKEPAEFRSLAVTFSQRTIFLPGLDPDPLTPLELSEAFRRAAYNGSLTLHTTSGIEVTWPIKPEYLADPDE